MVRTALLKSCIKRRAKKRASKSGRKAKELMTMLRNVFFFRFFSPCTFFLLCLCRREHGRVRERERKREREVGNFGKQGGFLREKKADPPTRRRKSADRE